MTRSAAAFALLVLFGFAPAQASASAFRWREGADGLWAARKDQERYQVPVFVYFRTDWCGVCKKFDASVLADDDVKKFLESFAKVTVNPEKGKDERALASQFGVRGYPSLWVIPVGGKPRSVPIYREPGGFIAGVRKLAGKIPKPEPTPTPRKVDLEVIPKGVPRPIEVMMEDRNYRGAIERIDAELEKDPTKTDLHLARGLCHRGLRKDVDAAMDFDLYLRANPADVAVRVLLARTYLNLTMYEDAATELEKLVGKDPPGEALWLLGEALNHQGKKAQARKHYAAACKAGYEPACGTR